MDNVASQQDRLESAGREATLFPGQGAESADDLHTITRLASIHKIIIAYDVYSSRQLSCEIKLYILF